MWGGTMIFISDTLNLDWKVVVQKEPRGCRAVNEVEDVVIGMQALDEELVTQSSMSQQLFHANMEIEDDEVGVTQVEQVVATTTQAKATYNSNDDLQETQPFINNP
jgi:hypothetical protein